MLAAPGASTFPEDAAAGTKTTASARRLEDGTSTNRTDPAGAVTRATSGATEGKHRLPLPTAACCWCASAARNTGETTPLATC